MVLNYSANHPITGAGFGSFWQIGKQSPINKITSQSWLLGVLHSHNGYLEVLVTTGIPGMILAVVATIIIPIKRIFCSDFNQAHDTALILSMLVLCITMNLMETQLFARDKQLWMVYLMVIVACKGLGTNNSRRTATRRQSYTPAARRP